MKSSCSRFSIAREAQSASRVPARPPRGYDGAASECVRGASSGGTSAPGEERADFAFRLAQILFVLDDERERLADGRGIELAHAERTETARPVERLGDARRLSEIELPEAGHEPRHLRPQLLVRLGDLEGYDLRFLLGAGEVDEEVEAAADERLGELERAVRREDGEGPRPDRAELGNRYLEVAQDLEQEGLELRIGLVDLVDQEDDAPRGDDRAEQRTLEEEVGGEDVARHVLPAPSLRPVGLDA